MTRTRDLKCIAINRTTRNNAFIFAENDNIVDCSYKLIISVYDKSCPNTLYFLLV